MNGGEVKVTGDVRFPKFKELIPSLRILSDRVLLKQGNYLGVRYSGDMKLTGTEAPYLLSGSCRIHEANLTSFEIPEDKGPQKDPILRWDIKCEGKEKLFVNTSVMNAEFKGDLNLLGNNVQMGLLGNLESTRGSILFRERRFNLNSGTVKFEAPNKILPRFNISSRATVQETSTTTAGQTKPGQNYEVSLQVYGIPSSYKILLTSTPELAEADIISLLLLGVTSRGQDGNYLDLGTTIVGQLPIQSKLESQLGVDIRLNSQTTTTSTKSATPGSSQSSSTLTEVSVPSVKIQKEITNKTKVSYSNSLEAIPFRELKIEHMLDDNLTVNGIAIERSRTGFENQTTQSYGVDFRYRFQFE
jgi:translocation and assembly module TamB